MSGPLHGLQNSVVGKTGGADNYYNNGYYPGWAHWGMAIANPLIASPIYNKDGDMSFKYNRVKACIWDGAATSAVSGDMWQNCPTTELGELLIVQYPIY